MIFLQEQRVNTLVDKDIVNVPPRYYWPIPFETLSKSKGKITNGYGLARDKEYIEKHFICLRIFASLWGAPLWGSPKIL